MNEAVQNSSVSDGADIYNKSETNTDVSKCPGCGSSLSFHPEKECLHCIHCGTLVKFTTELSKELPFSFLTSGENKWTETHVYCCDNCGAREILARTEIAKACGFCGTTNIVETKELSGLKPNAIVPFKLTKESAIERVIKWTKKKFFAPKRFKEMVTPEDVSGIYNPAFTFDSSTETHYSGRLGRTETYTVRQGGKTVTRTRTVYFNISGTYSGDFNDVLVQASTVINQKDLGKIQPFDTAGSKDYDNNFLFGYAANQYTKDGPACWEDAKKLIDGRIKAAILSRYTYSTVQSFHAETSYNDNKFRYILLPVYVGHCDWKKKVYNFFVNGENGKITGKTPVSAVKVAVVTGIAVLAVAGIALLLKLLNVI